MSPTHHAVRDLPVLQQREDTFVIPARMPEFNASADPSRELFQEVLETCVVSGVVRSELDQQDGPLIRELMPRCGDPLDPHLGRVEPFGVGQPPRRLDRQPKRIREPAPPALECSQARPAVEAAVELDRVEALRVEPESIAKLRVTRVEHVTPVVIAPAASAYVDRHSESSVERAISGPR